MSAESDDLLNWKKTGKFVLPAPEGYDGNDWRDPFILWEEESQQYIMILGGPKIKGKTDENRKNCLVYIKRFVGMAF